jgi:hypothetical protein
VQTQSLNLDKAEQNAVLVYLRANLDSILSILTGILYIVFFVDILKIGYMLLSQSIPCSYFDMETVIKDLQEIVILEERKLNTWRIKN